jgi:hypothetical protein
MSVGSSRTSSLEWSRIIYFEPFLRCTCAVDGTQEDRACKCTHSYSLHEYMFCTGRTNLGHCHWDICGFRMKVSPNSRCNGFLRLKGLIVQTPWFMLCYRSVYSTFLIGVPADVISLKTLCPKSCWCTNEFNIYPRSRSCRLIGLWDVKDRILSRHSLTDGSKLISPTHRLRSTSQKHCSSASGTHLCWRLREPQGL